MENSKRTTLLILSDGKVGHEKQSLAVAQHIPHSHLTLVQIFFKTKFSRFLLYVGTLFPLFKNYCHFLLKNTLTPDTYSQLTRSDLIISTGAAVAYVNLLLSKYYNAKSIVIMTPPLWRQKAYDLRIIPNHDRPKKYPNTLVTLATPTAVTPARIQQAGIELAKSLNISQNNAVCFFIGGDTSKTKMDILTVKAFIEYIHSFAIQQKRFLFITTSRRTSPALINFLKYFFLSGSCHAASPPEKKIFQNAEKLLLIPAEKDNHVEVSVESMMGVSDFIFVTEDSLSMISEAASSGRKVIVLRSSTPSASKIKHDLMIKNLTRQQYVYPATLHNIQDVIQKATATPLHILNEHSNIKQAVEAIL